jgi:ABC-type proline/glycine betaine transport system permease subunit
MSEDVLTSVIDKIKTHFGDLVVSRGKEHTFLGMNLTFKDDGSLTIEMKKYIEEAIELFGQDVSKNVTSTATKKLFEITAATPALDTVRVDVFHSVAAKLFWVMKRSRPDIETTISFLCIRVSRSNEDDWAKLKRLL